MSFLHLAGNPGTIGYDPTIPRLIDSSFHNYLYGLRYGVIKPLSQSIVVIFTHKQS